MGRNYKPKNNRGDKQVKVGSVKSIQDKLHALAVDDRNDREQSQINWDNVISNDKKRVAEVANSTKQYGYIDSTRFGKQTEDDAWLVVQHAIHDVPFMKKYLKLMEQQISDNKDVTANYPLLVDRIAMLENKKQTYGTQFVQDDNGKYVPHPIKDMKNIDTYRSKFNMTPFAEELAYFENQSIR